jgi:hypothetical protein
MSGRSGYPQYPNPRTWDYYHRYHPEAPLLGDAIDMGQDGLPVVFILRYFDIFLSATLYVTSQPGTGALYLHNVNVAGLQPQELRDLSGNQLILSYGPEFEPELRPLVQGDRVSLSCDLLGYPERPHRGTDYGIRGIVRTVFWTIAPPLPRVVVEQGNTREYEEFLARRRPKPRTRPEPPARPIEAPASTEYGEWLASKKAGRLPLTV